MANLDTPPPPPPPPAFGILDLTSPSQNQTFEISAGRILSFAEYGCPKGTPIFFMHGYIGSRVDACEWHETAVAHDVRIICIDRPGYGLSTFQPSRRIPDLAADVRALARHLDIPSYYVFGQSGGGPYALACAFSIPKPELRGVAVIAGMAPWACGQRGSSLGNRLAFWTIAYWPWMARVVMKATYGGAYDMDQGEMEKWYAKAMKKVKRDGDREFLSRPDTMRAAIASIREGFRQGTDAAMYDGHLYTSDWGFELEDIGDEQTVSLFYGTKDENCPVSHGRYIADRVPGAELIEFEGDTHFTLYGDRYREIMTRMLERGGSVSGRVDLDS